jgi:hypothetical protein
MGYCHYWEIEQEIGRESFSRIIADVERIILTLDDMGVRLAGPLGKGLPEMDAAHIAFNGLWDCGHGTLLKHRTCDGNCSYETFPVVRTCNEIDKVQHGRSSDSCKTGFRPCDLAVQCVLLIAKHHLKDRIQVWSGGSDYHWNDARLLCYVQLSYPLNQYRIDRDAGLILV